MKKLTIALVVLMGVSTATVANDTHDFFRNLVKADLKVRSLEELKFRVTGTELAAKSVLEVKDSKGNTIYKENVSSEEFDKVFNFANLQDGKYKFFLTTGGVSFAKEFEIVTETKRIAK